MRVALIQPPPGGGITGSYLVHEPLNLIGLGTAIRDWAKAEVQIWDYQVSPYSDSDLQKRIKDFSPTLVGFTAMTSQIKGAGRLAEVVKKIDDNIFIIAGGQHPTALPVQTLEEFPAFDAMVVGEGEFTLTSLAKGDDPKQIPGLAIRDERGKPFLTKPATPIEDLDAIPIPDRDIVDRNLYSSGPVVLGQDRSFVRPITVNLSRGCPFRCDFCSANIVYGNKVRFRSIDNIREELTSCKEKYGINHVSINDSLFSYREKFAFDVGELLASLGITWDCRARADNMTREFANRIAALGCKKIFMGAEAGSQRVLDAIGKQLSIDQLKEAFKVSKEAKIVRGTQFIVGAHPTQTEAEVMESLALAKKLDPEYCSFSIIMPLPGTPAWQSFSEQGLIMGSDWDAFNFYGSRPSWKTHELSPDDLVRLQKKCMLRFYLRPGYLIRRFIREAKGGRLGYQIRGALTLLRFAGEKRVTNSDGQCD